MQSVGNFAIAGNTTCTASQCTCLAYAPGTWNAVHVQTHSAVQYCTVAPRPSCDMPQPQSQWTSRAVNHELAAASRAFDPSTACAEYAIGCSRQHPVARACRDEQRSCGAPVLGAAILVARKHRPG